VEEIDSKKILDYIKKDELYEFLNKEDRKVIKKCVSKVEKWKMRKNLI